MTASNEVLPPGWRPDGDVLRVLDAMPIPDPGVTTFSGAVDVRFDRRPPQTVRVGAITTDMEDARFEVHTWTRHEPFSDPDGLLVLRVGEVAVVIAQLRHPTIQDEGWAIVAHLRAWLARVAPPVPWKAP